MMMPQMMQGGMPGGQGEELPLELLMQLAGEDPMGGMGGMGGEDPASQNLLLALLLAQLGQGGEGGMMPGMGGGQMPMGM